MINAVSTQIVQVVPSCPSCCPPSAAGTTLGIYVIPVVALCCSAYVCCAVESGVACCATRCTAIATLKTSTTTELITVYKIVLVYPQSKGKIVVLG